MTDDSDEFLAGLPARLRLARQENGLSLEALAKSSGVSRSMLSQIERGESSPTIATLMRLLRALDLDVAGVLNPESKTPQIHVLRADQTPTIDDMGAGCRVRIMSPPQDVGRNEIYELRFEAGGQLDSAAHQRGTIEILSVINGAVEVQTGEVVEQLGRGDSARYTADIPHCIRALNGTAKAVLVVEKR